MRRQGSKLFPWAAVFALSAAALSGCAAPPAGEADKSSAPATSSSAAAGGKIPVTTASEEARKEFLQGRDKAERLLAQDSIQHFDKALSLDPNFALAELGRANASQTAKDFFDHLKKAVALAGKASEGERLLILANEAGANGEAAKQKEHLDKLVAAHPQDERAHFNLGGYHFGQQDFAAAVQHYKKATELAPSYSPAYNILGYAYRQQGDYANAEQAFKKYIELIPNDPNPYDSYAELLLKMGKYEESIAQYRKALSIDPNFVASRNGIAADLLYMGKPEEAAAELRALSDKARGDGDRRTALFAMTVVQADGGKLDKALEEVEKQYALGEKIGDVAAMAGDLQLKGNILAEMGKYDEAKAEFEKLLRMTEESTLSPEIKNNARLFHHYNLVTVALGKKDFAAAKSEAEAFRKGAEGAKNPNQSRQAHELAGMIALAEKDYDRAIAELQQANQQNPQNLYRLSQAYQGKGDNARAKEFAARAAGFNSLPQLNYAFVRTKAQKLASG
jgi:tetratricopeptide (TPR) repeat protein